MCVCMVQWRRKQGKKRIRKERNEKWSDNRERERGRERKGGKYTEREAEEETVVM